MTTYINLPGRFWRSAMVLGVACLVVVIRIDRAYGSAQSTFCVGVNVQGTDERVLNDSLSCTIASNATSSSSSSASSDSGGGGDQTNEQEQAVSEPVPGGTRHSQGDRQEKLIEYLKNPNQPAPIVPYRESWSSSSARPPIANVPPTEPFRQPQPGDVVGIFKLRLRILPPWMIEGRGQRWREESEVPTVRMKSSSSLRGIWSSLFFALPSRQERTVAFWNEFGYDVVDGPSTLAHHPIMPSTVVALASMHAAASDPDVDVQGTIDHSLLAALQMPDMSYIQANPSELLPWGIILLIALLLLIRRILRARRTTNNPMQQWEDTDDADEFQGE